MQMASSANWTCIELASTSEYTATVRIFSSLQARMMRTAISPRFAIKIFSNIWHCYYQQPDNVCPGRVPPACGDLRSNLEQWLAEFDGLGVLDQDLSHHSFGFSLDFVHDFHRLDNADDRFRVDLGTDVDIGT